MAKNKTGLYTGIAIAVVVVIAIIVGVVLANKGGDSGSTGDNPGDTPTAAVSFDTIDEEITFGDYDGMYTLSKSIQNGEKVGAIVKIEGTVSHPMSTYSVVQKNADGTKTIGTQFFIDGAEDDGYPADGDRIIITGEIVENGPMVFVIRTTPENIRVVNQ